MWNGNEWVIQNSKDISLVIKDASGNRRKIHVGLDWIQQNDEMMYHLDIMVAHVSTKDDLDQVPLSKHACLDVFQDDLGASATEKATMKLLQGAKSVGQTEELSRLLTRQPLTEENCVVASAEVNKCLLMLCDDCP
ncbi:hypothetical protein ANCDUO_12250 [Ancylostoma duodenale]|uniref:Uncharacterized protein n=1 Tax=Ancylostoma duodenale TaxID=51022 RepID=A0A0C2CLU3_9BILA|nr:hypothetical protein ANCDUO_12250 [Ancylostoma duodenale]